MRFSSYINNQRCLEWGLNANQGALFDLLNQAASWAKEIIVDSNVFYWVSRNEVIKELPLFYAKPDTVYRHFVDLDKKELIEYRKVDGKDLIRLTTKGKTWNEFNSEINPNNTTELGNKSESTRIEIRKSSDLNPTNNNKNTSDHNNPPVSPQGEPSPDETKKSQSGVEVENPEMVDLPDYVNRESWIAYCQMRKAKRSAIKTEHTLKLCLRDLAKHSGGNAKLATAILEQSIANCWTGIFALKGEFSKPSGAVNAHDKSGAWAIGRTITVKSGAMR